MGKQRDGRGGRGVMADRSPPKCRHPPLFLDVSSTGPFRAVRPDLLLLKICNMKRYRRPGIFPAIFIGLLLVLIVCSILSHLFFPFYPLGFYGWHPFFPWGGFFFLRGLVFIGLLFFIGRRLFWGRRWAYGGPGWGYGGPCPPTENNDYPRGRRPFREFRDSKAPFEKTGNRNTDDYLELVSGFGVVEKKISSKNFHGGDVTTMKGRLIIDLRPADFTGAVRLRVTQIEGLTTILTPPTWEVRAGEGTLFTTYQDGTASKAPTDPNKVLIIDGTCVMGEIEVRTS